MFVRCSQSDKSVASIAPSPPTPAQCHHPAEDGRKEGRGWDADGFVWEAPGKETSVCFWLMCHRGGL